MPEGASDSELTSRRERWLREVSRAVRFVEAKLDATPHGVLVVGEGARSLDTLGWLADDLGLPAEPWNPLLDMARGPEAPDPDLVATYGCEATVALGLAVLEGNAS
jgi:hypothetical protein